MLSEITLKIFTLLYIFLVVLFIYFSPRYWSPYSDMADCMKRGMGGGGVDGGFSENGCSTINALNYTTDNILKEQIAQLNAELVELEKADEKDEKAIQAKTKELAEAVAGTHKLSTFFLKNQLWIYILLIVFGGFSLLTLWYDTFRPIASIALTHKPFLLGFLQYIIIISLIAITIFFILYTPYPLTIFINILNILIISGMVAMIINDESNSYKMIYLAGLFAFIISLIVAMRIFSTAVTFIIIAITAVLFVVYSLQLKDTTARVPGAARVPGEAAEPGDSYFILLVKYLPCLLIQFSTYISQQFGLVKDTNTIILLVIEFILILLRLVIPYIWKLYQKKTLPQGNVLVENPISLHYLTNIGNFISEKDTSGISLIDNPITNYNYALSFWLWIIPQSSSVNTAYFKPTNLININNLIKVNFNKHKIEFWASTTHDWDSASRGFGTKEKVHLVKVYTLTKIKYQKWNNIIINYSGGTLDIFINTSLVSSTPNIVPLNDFNGATTGEPIGIYGGIKNIVYYKNILKTKEINTIYKYHNI